MHDIALRKRFLQFLTARNDQQSAVLQFNRSLFAGVFDQLVVLFVQAPPVISEDNHGGVCGLVGPHMNCPSFLIEDKGQVDYSRIALRLIIIFVPSERIPAVVLIVQPVVPSKDAANDGHNQSCNQGDQPDADGKCLVQAFHDDAGVGNCENAHEGGNGRESSFQPARDGIARSPDGGQDADSSEDAEDPVPAKTEHQQRHQGANESQNVTKGHILFYVVFPPVFCSVWLVVTWGGVLKDNSFFYYTILSIFCKLFTSSKDFWQKISRDFSLLIK